MATNLIVSSSKQIYSAVRGDDPRYLLLDTTCGELVNGMEVGELSNHLKK